MAIFRKHATHVMELEQKLRSTSVLRFQNEHFLVDGFEATVTDPQTGQIAVLRLTPVNAGECDGCSHVGHQAACAAFTTFSKDACLCPVRPVRERNDENDCDQFILSENRYCEQPAEFHDEIRGQAYCAEHAAAWQRWRGAEDMTGQRPVAARSA